jgi:phage terminase small subunit
MIALGKKTQEAEKQMRDLLDRVRAAGMTEGYYLFVTTLDQYLKQLEILKNLYNIIKKEGYQVTGPKGELMLNPAVREYKGYIASLTTTAKTLSSLVKDFGSSGDEVDELQALLEEVIKWRPNS